MLIENCLQQINASRAARKACWCFLTADTFQPQISVFFWSWLRQIVFMASDCTGVTGLHSKGLQWNTHPCSYLWSIVWEQRCWQPFQSLWMKCAWDQAEGRCASAFEGCEAETFPHLAEATWPACQKRGLWNRLTRARLETGERWLLWGFEETQMCFFFSSDKTIA